MPDSKEHSAVVESRLGPGMNRAMIVMLILSVLVFLVNFRPWAQGITAEDWATLYLYRTFGVESLLPGGFAERPLFQFTNSAGLVLFGGGFFGAFLWLALIKLGQLWLAWWALRPVILRPWVLVALSATIALHPWWDGAIILRWTGAGTSLLFGVFWLGALIRSLRGNRWWLIGVVVGVLASVLTYQALTVSFLFGAVALSITFPVERFSQAISSSSGEDRLGTQPIDDPGFGWPQRVAVVAATGVGIVLTVLYNVIIAPALFSTYAQTQADPYLRLGVAARSLNSTVVHFMPLLVVAAILLTVLLAGMFRRGAITWWQATIVFCILVCAPLTGFVFAQRIYNTMDPDRISFPAGFTVWVSACALLIVAEVVYERRSRFLADWQNIMAIALLAVGLVASALAYRTFSEKESGQQSLLTVLEPEIAKLEPGQVLVVENLDGFFGRGYTFLPYDLAYTLNVIHQFEDGFSVVLCTPQEILSQVEETYRTPVFIRERLLTPTCESILAGNEWDWWFAGTGQPLVPVETVTSNAGGHAVRIIRANR